MLCVCAEGFALQFIQSCLHLNPHSNVSDISYLPQDGTTPLIVASQKGHSDVVNILIRSGAGVDVPKNVSNVVLFLLSLTIQYSFSCTLLVLIKKCI